MDVDLRGLYGLVPKPEGDHRLIDAVMQQLHRSAVPQDMRRDALADQGRACSRRGQAVLAHQMLQRIAAQPISPNRGEERIGIVVPLAYPGLQQLRRVAPKRCAPLFPALADATDMRTGSQNDVATAQADQLRCAKTRLQSDSQQCMITPAGPCR